MKLTLFAMATLAVAAALPASAINTFNVPNINQTTFNLAQAYPCNVLGYGPNSNIADLRTFRGVCGDIPTTIGAAPGLLCLRRSGNFLDVNCFAVIPSNQFGPCVVQAFRFTKEVPGSFKCPDVFGMPHFDGSGNLIPYRYLQFGSGIRTWWALNFTQPGTRFLLEVVSVCRATAPPDGTPGSPVVHKDTWTWRVVASVETLANVIELMHGGAVSTLEVPCILGEDMYQALVDATSRLRGAIGSGSKADIGSAIFDFEALIVANCLFIEVLNPVVVFPGPKQFTDPAGVQPPGNLAQTVFFGANGTAVAGIIDTIENPCCCKLLVDLEWIALRSGLTGQTPTLPVF